MAAGRTHGPGSVVELPSVDYDLFYVRRMIAAATPENVAAVAHAVRRGLPVVGYEAPQPDKHGIIDEADMSDPREVARRSTFRR